MPKTTDIIRDEVLEELSDGKRYQKIGRVTYRISGHDYHIKVKTGNLEKYPFNINDTVLAADFEVYICGNSSTYYVIPMSLIKDMHEDLDSLPDYAHPGYTVVDVYPNDNKIVYGRRGKYKSVGRYRNFRLTDPAFEAPNFKNIKEKYGTLGEGADHKDLKIWIAKHPYFINVTNVSRIEVEKHKFLSNDLPDIVFKHGNGIYTIVEIETVAPNPGAWQLIKYRALLSAELDTPIDDEKIRCVLVAWAIPNDVREFCKKHNIACFTKRL